jgi:hypothetical protein
MRLKRHDEDKAATNNLCAQSEMPAKRDRGQQILRIG